MQKILLILMMILAMSSQLFSQSTIEGTVSDQQRKAIDGFNVILMQRDSTVVKGGFFFDGEYQISCPKGAYILQLSALGYQTYNLNIAVQDSLLQLADIRLLSAQIALGEVVVKGRRNIFSQKDDKLIVNVKNTMLEESGNASDVMRKSAVLNVDGDNNVSVLGKNKTAVYVNGKKISSPELLSMISSKEIQSVEVIDQPSAKYSADIDAVVNIITLKNTRTKHGLTFVNSLTKRSSWSNNSNLQYFNSTAKNNLFVSYSYGNYRRKNDEEYLRQYPLSTDNDKIRNKIDKQLNIKNQHYARLSNSYSFNPNNILTFVTNAGYYKGAYKTINRNEMTKNNVATGLLVTDIHSPIQRTLLNGMLSYSLLPQTEKGVKWDFSAEKYYYSHQKKDNIKEKDKNGAEKIRFNDIDNIFHLHSAEVLAELNVNQALNLQTGLQFADYRNISKNQSTALSADKNDDFENNEERYASFATLRWQKNRWQIDAGLRWELLKRDAQINRKSVVDKVSNDFSPNLCITKDLSNKLTLSASASRKLTRPSFHQLNPAITYIDSLSIIQGNPNLKNETIDLYILNLSFMKYASLSLYYKNISDAMIWFIEGLPENKNISRGIQINIPKQNIWGMDAVLPYQNKHLTAYVASGWQYVKNQSEGYNHLKQFSWYLKSGLDVNLPFGLKANLTGLYFSEGINGIWHYDNAYQIDAELQKQFWDKRLSLSLSVKDIFHSNKMHSQLNMSHSTTDYTYYKDNQFIRLRVRYSLNNAKRKAAKKSLLNEARSRIDSGME